MGTPAPELNLDGVLARLADLVAERVIERQREEAERAHRPVHITAAEMAKRLNVTEQHLCNLRSLKRGPPFIKVGRSIRYLVNGE